MADKGFYIEISGSLERVLDALGVEESERERFLVLFFGLALRNYMRIIDVSNHDLHEVDPSCILSLQQVYDQLIDELELLRSQGGSQNVHIHGDVHLNLGVNVLSQSIHYPGFTTESRETRTNLPMSSLLFPPVNLRSSNGYTDPHSLLDDYEEVVALDSEEESVQCTVVHEDVNVAELMSEEGFDVSDTSVSLLPVGIMLADQDLQYTQDLLQPDESFAETLEIEAAPDVKVLKDRWVEADTAYIEKKPHSITSFALGLLVIILIFLTFGLFYLNQGAVAAESPSQEPYGSIRDASGLDPPYDFVSRRKK